MYYFQNVLMKKNQQIISFRYLPFKLDFGDDFSDCFESRHRLFNINFSAQRLPDVKSGFSAFALDSLPIRCQPNITSTTVATSYCSFCWWSSTIMPGNKTTPPNNISTAAPSTTISATRNTPSITTIGAPNSSTRTSSFTCNICRVVLIAYVLRTILQ